MSRGEGKGEFIQKVKLSEYFVLRQDSTIMWKGQMSRQWARISCYCIMPTQDILLGQSLRLHVVTSLSVGHASPLLTGRWVTWRFLEREPTPQVAEQADHGDHSETRQGSGSGKPVHVPVESSHCKMSTQQCQSHKQTNKLIIDGRNNTLACKTMKRTAAEKPALKWTQYTVPYTKAASFGSTTIVAAVKAFKYH